MALIETFPFICQYHPNIEIDLVLTLLHSERPKLYTILAFLSAIRFNAAYLSVKFFTNINFCVFQLPGHLQVRLQAVQNWQPPAPSTEQMSINSSTMLTWLKRIQFKLGQIEVQSSAVTQFYTV